MVAFTGICSVAAIDRLTVEIGRLTIEIDRLTTEIDRLTTEIDRLTIEIDSLTIEIVACLDQCSNGWNKAGRRKRPPVDARSISRPKS